VLAGQRMPSIQTKRGDITKLAVDAIVNAANELMLGGGGVDGAIHRAAGPQLREACRKVPEVRPGVRCPTGEARITPGFHLQAAHVIHTVGPVWRGGGAGEDALLASCYRASLELARGHAVRSIAFPAISCGVFGFPPERASAIAVEEIRRHLEGDTTIAEVWLVAFDEEMLKTLAREVDRDGDSDSKYK
jgi:O-acetyl-ADP-ribose deacetylase